MTAQLPPWLEKDENGESDRLISLLGEVDDAELEKMAASARASTRRHFGRTVSLYAPLYLSNYCSGGCAYCGYAADRRVARSKLTPAEARAEMLALRQMGIEEILLLTGERVPEADLDYLRQHVEWAAGIFPAVAIETFPMTAAEYRILIEAGCTGVTLYQETYDPKQYNALHRWGAKSNYAARVDAPERALAAGMRFVGVGALLGLAEPVLEAVRLFRHVKHLQRQFWRAGITVSFPRIRPQTGGYQPDFPVSERWLAQMIFAFRICLPDVPLVLSTREAPAFRDGMAGLGISKMSVASRTTVGGYSAKDHDHAGQFEVSDNRQVSEFCHMLSDKGLEPVFKNWDAVYRG